MERVVPEKDRGEDTVVFCTTPPLLVESNPLGTLERVRLVVEARVAERFVVVAFVVLELVTWRSANRLVDDA